MNSLGPANSPIAHDLTIAGKTDIFLKVSLRRLASTGRFRWGVVDEPRTKDRIKMSDRPSHNLGGLDIEMARRIDKVCRRFEADWRAGAEPGIEDYVVDVSHQGRPALRAELEALESRAEPVGGDVRAPWGRLCHDRRSPGTFARRSLHNRPLSGDPAARPGGIRAGLSGPR